MAEDTSKSGGTNNWGKLLPAGPLAFQKHMAGHYGKQMVHQTDFGSNSHKVVGFFVQVVHQLVEFVGTQTEIHKEYISNRQPYIRSYQSFPIFTIIPNFCKDTHTHPSKRHLF